MTGAQAREFWLKALRDLLEIVPQQERHLVCSDLATKCMEMARELRPPSGLFQIDPPPDTDKSSE